MDAFFLECVAHRGVQHRAFTRRNQRADLLATGAERHQRVIAVEFDEIGRTLQYAGGNNANTNCTQVIGDTVSFVGNSLLKINCSGSGTRPIGSSVAALVE